MKYVSIDSRRKLAFSLVYLIALLFALTINGALPFITSPTLGQAVWTTGFSQSFLNESLSTLYSHNIGIPEPAAIAFGLAGAYVAAIFMALGMHAVDAYTCMVALWLSVAFFSAYKLSRFFSVEAYHAILAALAWCTMPVVWSHAGYSMVSIGIALLPLYFLAVLKLLNKNFDVGLQALKEYIGLFFFYFSICLLAVFMDGYTFMMFATGSSIIAAWFLFREPSGFRQNLYRLSIHILSFGLAYLAYASYLGKPQFEAAQLDFFRGWGVDITFWLIPSTGIHWIADLLGFSNYRTDDYFFGDSSIWKTTFSLPLMLAALISIAIVRKLREKVPLILIAVFGFYMALGPSFKFNSIKPADYDGGPTMEEKYAISATGTSALSLNLPGFKNMRASYRWQALGVFGAWALILTGMSGYQRKKIILVSSTFLSLVILLNLPEIPKKLLNDINHRSMFFEIDKQLLSDLEKQLKPNENVVFLPWRNDFLVNYIAAKLDIRTFNIGGDKNLEEARRHWPEPLKKFQMGKIDPDFSERVAIVLAGKYADVVILPYIDLLWAARDWPAKLQYKKELETVEEKLAEYGFLNIEQRDYYSIIRFNPNVDDQEQQVQKLIHANCEMISLCLEVARFEPENTLSQVGIIKDGELHSSDREGFLLYGPYKPLVSGKYIFRMQVRVGNLSEGWIDVVSSKGQVTHTKIPITKIVGADKVVSALINETINLNGPVNDIEIRVYVTEQDSLIIEDYSLRKID